MTSKTKKSVNDFLKYGMWKPDKPETNPGVFQETKPRNAVQEYEVKMLWRDKKKLSKNVEDQNEKLRYLQAENERLRKSNQDLSRRLYKYEQKSSVEGSPVNDRCFKSLSRSTMQVQDERLKELEKKLKIEYRSEQELTKYCKEIQEDLEELREKHALLSDEHEKLKEHSRRTIEELSKSLKDEHARNTQLDATVERLRDSLHEKIEENDHMQNLLTGSRRDLESAKQSIEQMRHMHQSDTGGSQARHKNDQRIIHDLKATNQVLENQLRDMHSKFLRRTTLDEENLMKIRELEGQNDALRSSNGFSKSRSGTASRQKSERFL